MKKLSIVLAMLLAISLTIPIFLTSTRAVPVTPIGTSPNNIEWITDGYNFYTDAAGLGKGFAYQPEFLMLSVDAGVSIITPTTITIQGTDALGQPISAQVFIPGSSANPITQQAEYIFIDPSSGYPVAFSSITNIMQQGGTDGNKFLISTVPETELYSGISGLPIFAPGTQFTAAPYFQQYMGQYDLGTEQNTGQGWQPGIYTWYAPTATNPYWITMGIGKPIGHQTVPFQPMLPEPITVYVNWHDQNHDLVPGDSFLGIPDDFGTIHTGTIYIEGLNADGQKIILSHTFNPGDNPYYTFDCCGEIDKVWGGNNQDTYYIFTTPPQTVDLFYYFITVDHLTIYPGSFDILANPYSTDGKTSITVALRDVDNNLVNWGGVFANKTFTNLYLSFYTSGGTINPSYNVWIPEESSTATVTLCADTNPRTITVKCDANVPEVNLFSHNFHGDLNLMVWTEMTFDGVNLVPPTAPWPIHTLQCGYTDAQGNSFTMNAPMEPALPTVLGGPAPDGIKLDGPLYEVTINLYQGCNLISSPVYPMFGANTAFGGIPMKELFGTSGARDAIEAVWWWDASALAWYNYIPATGATTSPTAPIFTDGVGYWIKAEKPCVLEISGVAMENAPFLPAEYTVYPSWNLMGFTSIAPMNTVDYLESLATGNTAGTLGLNLASAVGPIWTYDAQARAWVRDPGMLWPTNAFWMNYKLSGTANLSP
jgi:hypothetical protein